MSSKASNLLRLHSSPQFQLAGTVEPRAGSPASRSGLLCGCIIKLSYEQHL